jgi:hypothetical protein
VSDERTLEHSPAPGSSPLAARAPRRRVVAVTGAASFLGANLIGVLEEEAGLSRILALDTKPPPTAGAKTRVYELSLTSAAAEERLAEAFAAEEVPSSTWHFYRRRRTRAAIPTSSRASARCTS